MPIFRRLALEQEMLAAKVAAMSDEELGRTMNRQNASDPFVIAACRESVRRGDEFMAFWIGRYQPHFTFGEDTH